MDSMNKEEGVRFQALMRGLAENFSATLTEDGMRLRYKALYQYTIEQLESASMRLLRTRVYTTMPTAAEFVLAIDGAASIKGEKQIQSIRRAIGGCGRNGKPNFHDPVTHYLVHNYFGWQNICNKKENEMHFFEKEFVEAYQKYEQSPEVLSIEGTGSNPIQILNVVKKLR